MYVHQTRPFFAVRSANTFFRVDGLLAYIVCFVPVLHCCGARGHSEQIFPALCTQNGAQTTHGTTRRPVSHELHLSFWHDAWMVAEVERACVHSGDRAPRASYKIAPPAREGDGWMGAPEKNRRETTAGANSKYHAPQLLCGSQ